MSKCLIRLIALIMAVTAVPAALAQSTDTTKKNLSFFDQTIGSFLQQSGNFQSDDNDDLTNLTAAPSWDGLKDSFFRFAPHQEKEDLLPMIKRQEGVDKPFQVRPFKQAGTVSSGLAPGAVVPANNTQAMERVQNQTVSKPFMQQEFTEYSNPALNHFGGPKYPAPFRHTAPHNPLPVGMNPLSFSDMPYLTGAPPSDLVQHALRLNASHRTAEMMLDPSLKSSEANFQGTMQQTADATADDAAGEFEANLHCASENLINVANEQAATPATGKEHKRSQSQAIWIVQQMYKQFFMPLAILLLLVGAVLTQTTTFVGAAFVRAERNPFEGISRAAVAIFLIPATQLAVSYSIDIGNAMTAPVRQAVDMKTIAQWSKKVTKAKSSLTAAERARQQAEESTMGSTTRAIYGSVHAILNSALMVLGVFQLIMVSYLFLLGPIAASMFAWPNAIGIIFRPVYANWLNALSNVVLWKFWWCVILLCMATRVHWLQETGGLNFSSPWEPVVYTAFLVMLGYVPFSALEFRPGDIVDQLLAKAHATPK